ncbi:MAG TPA: hypothetical protein VGV40_01370 [Solirubrobacteraceae bacterium]|nr:hypothetical protein [Solirubrobacteraceae bacterium]
MPDRALPPLVVSVGLALIAGLIAAILRLEGSQIAVIAVAGGVVVLAVGLSSTFGRRASAGEKATVGALRAGLGLATYGFVFLALDTFFDDANPLFLLWAGLAGVCGVLLSQLRVRERAEPGLEREAGGGEPAGERPGFS